MTYARLFLMYRLHRLTASQVWSYVPDSITEEQACMICGARPGV